VLAEEFATLFAAGADIDWNFALNKNDPRIKPGFPYRTIFYFLTCTPWKWVLVAPAPNAGIASTTPPWSGTVAVTYRVWLSDDTTRPLTRNPGTGASIVRVAVTVPSSRMRTIELLPRLST